MHERASGDARGERMRATAEHTVERRFVEQHEQDDLRVVAQRIE